MLPKKILAVVGDAAAAVEEEEGWGAHQSRCHDERDPKQGRRDDGHLDVRGRHYAVGWQLGVLRRCRWDAHHRRHRPR